MCERLSGPSASPSSPTPTVVLKRRRAKPFFFHHPWVFSGAIARVDGQPADGDEVTLASHDGQFIARGLWNSRSQIQVRLYSWDPERVLDEAFWRDRLQSAIRLRNSLPGYHDPEGACRLVFSESDGLSGLIVDRYGPYLNVQVTSLAIARRLDLLVAVLQELCTPQGMYLRTERGIGEAEGLDLTCRVLAGDVPEDPTPVTLDGIVWQVDLRHGQKTGLYLDQRENWRAAAALASQRRCLDVCAYQGGFALPCARAGATSVLACDTSKTAVELACRNAAANDLAHVEFVSAKALDFLSDLAQRDERFGMVICDPPKFARTAAGVQAASNAYRQLNELAIRVLEPDGLLLTCCCSQHVDRFMWMEILHEAAHTVRRNLQVLEFRGQSPDHPVLARCPETEYLKCFVCRVW